MSLHEQWFPGHLRDIPASECLELVAARPIGRISYCTEAGPVTVPVNHVLVDRDILLRTSPHSELGQHLLAEPRVCYQVDDFDEFNQSGWSVLTKDWRPLSSQTSFQREPSHRRRGSRAHARCTSGFAATA